MSKKKEPVWGVSYYDPSSSSTELCAYTDLDEAFAKIRVCVENGIEPELWRRVKFKHVTTISLMEDA